MSDRVILSIEVRPGGMIVDGPVAADAQIRSVVTALRAGGVTAIAADPASPVQPFTDEQEARLHEIIVAALANREVEISANLSGFYDRALTPLTLAASRLIQITQERQDG